MAEEQKLTAAASGGAAAADTVMRAASENLQQLNGHFRSEQGSENHFNSSQNLGAGPLHRSLFEKVKRGEIDEVVRLVREHNIDLKHVVDEAKNFS